MKQIVDFPIHKLETFKDNPRQINLKNFEKLKRDIKKDKDFLYRRPLLVNHANNKHIVYAGNHRLLAALQLGWETIPCIIDENLDEELMRERILRDNVQYAEFNIDMLANEWEFEIEHFDLPKLKIDDMRDFEILTIMLLYARSVEQIYHHEKTKKKQKHLRKASQQKNRQATRTCA